MRDRAGFPRKKNCLQNWESEPKIGHKQGFLILLKKMFSDFYWIYSSIKTYFTCCVPWQIPYFEKILFLRYRPQNALSQSDCMLFWSIKYLQNKLMIFCMWIQIHINKKLMEHFLAGHSQKWVWPTWFWDPKIECIWKRNRSNKLILCMLIQIPKN